MTVKQPRSTSWELSLRQRLLAGNRHHMLRPYASFAEASRAADVQAYLDGLRANYPPEQARDLLNALRSGGEEPPPAYPPTMPPQAFTVPSVMRANMVSPPAAMPATLSRKFAVPVTGLFRRKLRTIGVTTPAHSDPVWRMT